MILGQREANKVLPLVVNLEAYEAFLELINILHAHVYEELKQDRIYPSKDEAIGKLKLLDELKELKVRLKDSLNNGRPDSSVPVLF